MTLFKRLWNDFVTSCLTKCIELNENSSTVEYSYEYNKDSITINAMDKTTMNVKSLDYSREEYEASNMKPDDIINKIFSVIEF